MSPTFVDWLPSHTLELMIDRQCAAVNIALSDAGRMAEPAPLPADCGKLDPIAGVMAAHHARLTPVEHG
jgi:hypothetical protein